MDLKLPVNTQDHIQGKKTGTQQIELIEYGDYECSHCAAAYPIVKRIQKEMGDKLLFVFRNFPLQNVHPNAYLAALASEAAAEQGKFWEMHDYIFENPQSLYITDLSEMAENIGLDVHKFMSDVENKQQLKDKVEGDFDSGVRSGVNGTPTFYINGVKYNGSRELEPFLGFLKEVYTLKD